MLLIWRQGRDCIWPFGENSFLGGDNGADMLWNPTERLVSNVGTPVMGGMHPIYVFSCDQKEYTGNNNSYNMPAYVPSEAANDNTHALRILWDDLQSYSLQEAQVQREPFTEVCHGFVILYWKMALISCQMLR